MDVNYRNSDGTLSINGQNLRMQGLGTASVFGPPNGAQGSGYCAVAYSDGANTYISYGDAESRE